MDGDHGLIPGVTVTPGDAHDPVTYLEHLERTHQNILPHPDRHGECSLRSFAGLRGTGEVRHHLLRRAVALCRQNESGVQTVHICLRRVQDLYRCSNGKALRVGTCTANAGGVDRKYWGGPGGLPELSLLGQMPR